MVCLAESISTLSINMKKYWKGSPDMKAMSNLWLSCLKLFLFTFLYENFLVKNCCTKSDFVSMSLSFSYKNILSYFLLHKACVVGKVMTSQMYLCLTSRICGNVILHGRGGLRLQMALNLLLYWFFKIGLSWIIPVDSV